MGGEEAVQLVEETHGLLAGLGDEELGDVGTVDGLDGRVARYLPERTGQGERIVRHLCRTCIGQVFPFAGDGKAHQHGKEIPDGGHHEGQEHHDDHAVPLLVTTARRPRSVINPLHAHLGDHRKDAHEDDGDDEQADVVVADVRELVGNDGLQFLVVELADDAGRERYGVGPFVDATGEGVERIVVDDAELRHLHALTDAEILYQIIDPLVVFTLQRDGTHRRVDDARIGKVSNQEPNQHAAHHVWHPADEIIIGIRDEPCATIGPVRSHPYEKVAEEVRHPHHEAREHAKQKQRAEVVPALLRLYSNVFHAD